jgi:hypothetical protein
LEYLQGRIVSNSIFKSADEVVDMHHNLDLMVSVSLLRLLYDKVNDKHGYCMEAGQTKLTRYMDVFSSSF